MTHISSEKIRITPLSGVYEFITVARQHLRCGVGGGGSEGAPTVSQRLPGSSPSVSQALLGAGFIGFPFTPGMLCYLSS